MLQSVHLSKAVTLSTDIDCTLITSTLKVWLPSTAKATQLVMRWSLISLLNRNIWEKSANRGSLCSLSEIQPGSASHAMLALTQNHLWQSVSIVRQDGTRPRPPAAQSVSSVHLDSSRPLAAHHAVVVQRGWKLIKVRQAVLPNYISDVDPTMINMTQHANRMSFSLCKT